MKEELISVIVPVYNVETYLPKCIDSIISQTYKKLEIILIDDGSQDNSGKICDEYTKKDKRIKVVHKENGGVSSARNKGLELISGTYVIFIDSDDYLELDMIKKLYINIKETNSDISICNYSNIENDIKAKGSLQKTSNKQLNKEEFYNYLFYNTYYCGYLWNKLFKTNLIGKTRFKEEIHLLEDLIFISEVAEKCNRFYYDYDKYLYNYRIREDSALRSKFNVKQITSIQAREIALEYAKKYNCKSINVIKFNLLWDSIYYKYKLNIKIEHKKYRKYIIDSLKCTEYNFSKKLKLLIIYIIPNLYFKIKEKIVN